MNHWLFIIAAYGLTFIGTGGVCLWAFVTMRRAEHRSRQIAREG
ncbi:hypothetical protein [Rhizorhapis suberifaciens]|uniref:Heme exporter protein D n=1 Tax=Rhizorhapis suberifaciens TaxID=13656 RepID=A0A840HWH7_9SPHN|nr:hypothetical protein [Rhizorhapis suberifaciens]MBB4642313.1 hypothetical protein [Rhizorhapis suberifaciens]